MNLVLNSEFHFSVLLASSALFRLIWPPIPPKEEGISIKPDLPFSIDYLVIASKASIRFVLSTAEVSK